MLNSDASCGLCCVSTAPAARYFRIWRWTVVPHPRTASSRQEMVREFDNGLEDALFQSKRRHAMHRSGNHPQAPPFSFSHAGQPEGCRPVSKYRSCLSQSGLAFCKSRAEPSTSLKSCRNSFPCFSCLPQAQARAVRPCFGFHVWQSPGRPQPISD